MDHWKDSKAMNQDGVITFKMTSPKVKYALDHSLKLNWVDGSPLGSFFDEWVNLVDKSFTKGCSTDELISIMRGRVDDVSYKSLTAMASSGKPIRDNVFYDDRTDQYYITLHGVTFEVDEEMTLKLDKIEHLKDTKYIPINLTLDTSEKKEIVRADGSVHYYTDSADVANEVTIDFVSKDDIPAGDERYDKGLILRFIPAKDGRLGDHCVGFTAKGVFSVDWGDGVASAINSADEARVFKHYYKEEGTKTIKMLGTIDHFVSNDHASVGILKLVYSWGEFEETLDKDKMYLKDRNNLMELAANHLSIKHVT